MDTLNELCKKLSMKKSGITVLIGAGIPLCLLLFILLTKEPHLEPWMLIPLTIIPSGGALGGATFYLLIFLFPNSPRKLPAIVTGILLYSFILWLSAICAFNLTGHWD